MKKNKQKYFQNNREKKKNNKKTEYKNRKLSSQMKIFNFLSKQTKK